jgi:hypothetical protein
MKKLPFKAEHLLLGVCTVCCLYLVWKLNEIEQKMQLHQDRHRVTFLPQIRQGTILNTPPVDRIVPSGD